MREIKTPKGVRVIVSDRFGGASRGVYESLNLGFHVGDDEKAVEKNRKTFASFFGVGIENLCFMEQIHGRGVEVVNSNAHVKADGIITQNRDLVLCVMVADCVPIILFDNENGVVCAVHAGRKGAFLNITSNAIVTMRERLKASSINAFLGPSVKSCCYEIKDEILCEAREKFAFAIEEREGGYFLDLRKIVKKQLRENGVESITDDDICVCCDKRYFSYRRDGVCGRFAVGVKLA